MEILSSWREDELDHLGKCPACQESARNVRFTGLSDLAFGATVGEWTMYDCAGCGAAYLDPRPSLASIGRAYSRYYTHENADPQLVDLLLRHWKPRLKAGFLNAKYRYTLKNGSALGKLLGMFHQVSGKLEFAIRHVPPPKNAGERLLDVGCGNGDFLIVAQKLGYIAVGLEPDTKAVTLAQHQGLNVHEGLLPDRSFNESGFHHITLNHVLEHLHQPREALDQIYELLTPGGRLWISQPNLDAAGLKRFGKSWRGLEVPRHLVLFSFSALAKLLTAVGFVEIKIGGVESWVSDFYYKQSLLMSKGLDPYGVLDPTEWHREKATAKSAASAAKHNPELCESLTITAYRPATSGQ